MVQAIVGDIVEELQGTSGAGDVFTIWGKGGITSGQIKRYIDKSDNKLRGWVGGGPSDSSDAVVLSNVKDFEISYTCYQLLNASRSVIFTDGHNFTMDGLSIQRATNQLQVYMTGIEQYKDEWKDARKVLITEAYVFNTEEPRGVDEDDIPVRYDRVGSPSEP